MDLSDVLHHIALAAWAETRVRIANSPETRRFLELGLGLLREDLLRHTGPVIDGGDKSRLFDAVSRERILARDESLSANMFRRRWNLKNHYTEDLIAYLFRLGPQHERLDAMDAAADQLMTSVSFGELVRTLSAAALDQAKTDELSPLRMIFEVALPSHPRVREFAAAQQELLLPRWAGIYERVATAYRLELAPGRTWTDVALIFNTLLHGALVLRGHKLSSGEDVLLGGILATLSSLVANPGDLWVDTVHG
ncbi:hypothetical protein LWC34_36930 [Kibdelosporangium philippinense]|uniref:Uncharacterized protein n=1 Tax=Kibdelosporangium philippinense TaxID=211113 RepID=A0ABS8ZLB5_9PSEU|nr:hypothetical protein [Kibdelosporangium philippinense]MCE7008357.1 hypothetical protein [Kibdelosporangium philippinense]